MASTQRLSPTVSTESEMKSTQEGPVIETSTKDDVQLADFGYEQELKRSFGLIGMIGFSFSIVTCWTALGGVLIVGIESGGPPVMVWSWLGVSVLTLCVAYSFAEMCAAYPVAGGQYSWVAILAPPRSARALSYVTAWFMNTGIVAMGATNNFIGANFVLGIAQLNHPTYTIQRWHTVLTSYLISMLACGCNLFPASYLNRISSFILVWNVLSFVIVIVTILATNDHKQPASFVFTDFQNSTGFSSSGMAVMIGLLQSFFGMCCYDAPSKMVEEMRNPRLEAPRAIIWSVYLGAVTGFVFLVAAFFCVGDLATVAQTPTGVPLIQIFYDSTRSVAGASALSALIAIIILVAANSLMAEGSRALWAFSRDHGLPFSAVFRKVNQCTAVPMNAVLLCTVLQMGLVSIYFASYEGFSTVISIAVFGFYLSYALPLFVRLLSRFTLAHSDDPAILTAERTMQQTSPYSLGRWGVYINAIGLVFLLFALVDFNFPQVGPVDAGNMNYCPAAIGVIALIAAITWVCDGRKNFVGPTCDTLVVAGGEGAGKIVDGSGALKIGNGAEVARSIPSLPPHTGEEKEEKVIVM